MVGKTILDKKIVQFQKPTYSFGVISDVHINRTNQDAQGDLRKAFSAFRNRGITRVFCCGDISTNHTEDELALFKAVKDEYPEMVFRSCTGNHDVQFTEQQWQTYIGHGFTSVSTLCMYAEEINGDVFCLLPIKSWEGAHPYSSGSDPQADFYYWFRNDLMVDGKRVFLFMHFPLNSENGSMQYPGLKVGQHYGFDSGSEDNSIIKTAADEAIARGYCRNMTVFSGHSHYAFDVADKVFKARYLKFEMSNYGDSYTQFSKLEFLNGSNTSFSFPSSTTWTCSITPVSTQTPAQAIDGNLNTKFCAPSQSNQFNIVYDLKSACLDLAEFNLFRLFSGDDNAVFSNRSVKNMKISAKTNESDEWIEVLDVTDIPICNINKTLEYESYVDGQVVNQCSEPDPDFKDVIFLQEGSFAHVHVPSLVVPRDQDMNVIHSGHPGQQPAQGYVVDVYPDFVKLTGLEFNLKLFDADQRKGLVKVENRYVAECEGFKPIPNDYQPLEFVNANGRTWSGDTKPLDNSAYINTGILPSTDLRVYTAVTLGNNPGQWQALIGSTPYAKYAWPLWSIRYSNDIIADFTKPNNAQHSAFSVQISDKTDIQIEYDARRLSVNGIVQEDTSITDYTETGNYPIIIGGMYHWTSDVGARAGTIALYKRTKFVKISTGEVLGDFFPVKCKDTGVCGFFDIVKQQFHSSLNSIPFTENGF